MAYVNFTLDEIWDFANGASNIGSSIDSEVTSFTGAAEAAISKFRALIDVYEESIRNMDSDRIEIECIISDNERAIEHLRAERDRCKKAMDTSTDETREAAKSAYHSAQGALEDAIDLNEELRRLKDRLWRRIDEMRQSISNCESSISTLNSAIHEMERAGSMAKDNIDKVKQNADTAHKYADEILENLDTGDLSTYRSYIRVRFLDHNALHYLSKSLAEMARTLDERANASGEANAALERCMRDKITRAAIAKMREIEEDSSGAGGSFRTMAKKSRTAYEYVVDYLNLQMTYR